MNPNSPDKALEDDLALLRLEAAAEELEQAVVEAALKWHSNPSSADISIALNRSIDELNEFKERHKDELDLIRLKDDFQIGVDVAAPDEERTGILLVVDTESDSELVSELSQLRKEMDVSSLGDRPYSIAAAKLDRLMELEHRESEIINQNLQRNTGNKRYEDKIREIRDLRGDDKCWKDFEELFSLLPEGYTPPQRDTTVELAHCERFIASIHNPGTVYVSPEREIEKLRELLYLFRLYGYAEGIEESFTEEQNALFNFAWEEGVRKSNR